MTTTNFKPLQAQAFALSGAGAVSGATSITLKSFAQINGTLITMSMLGTIAFMTLEPGNGTLEEQISFTGVTQNTNGTATLTGVSTVTMVDPYTATSGLAQTHAGSTSAILSNTSGYYNQFVAKNDDATITGQYTFNVTTGRPKLASDVDTAVNEELVDLGQLARTSFAGTVNASTTQKGIVQIATQAQTDAGTGTGSTGAILTPSPDVLRSRLLSDYVVDTGAANAYAIAPTPAITAYTTGQIFSFKAVNANTTASTLSVSGLTTKAIKKNDGTVANALAAGDILAGQLVVVEYDGTNFQLITALHPQQIQNSTFVYAASSSGNDTYAITVSPVPAAYATGQVFYFKADVGNTGAASLNVNTLGALNILRVDGSALSNGDIAANQIVAVVVYDGSNCKMLSAVANAPKFANGTDFSRDMSTASGNLALAHGLGRAPRYVRITALINPAVKPGSSYGAYNGTTTSCVYMAWPNQAAVDNTNILNLTSTSATPNTQVATITVDATNITLAFTKGGTNGSESIAIMWEAES